ncbi:ribbon-helix-helix protein, CopG family [Athalassotoga saccharophila]|uniref:Ribbon-helix-helix protein CopG domain-containing protein n=1 Tax=Athalassotoga saccharophila TaxID=1441386 RepID=A0A6N4TFY3_9BACT|nr:CopG family transcriptional regulator [Athalassotoga saccharophila]BBJ28545.1 hypothetical protein ATHSA_1462 [Athalassotoga saccharophila]BBJ29082.1 hypothetical protein ATHSA_p10035 [Athalassotoga saccharophila]
MKTISVKIDNELLEELNTQAHRLRVSKSVIIRAAVEDYLKKVSHFKNLLDFLESVPEVEPELDEIKVIEEYESRKALRKVESISLEEAKKELNI